ncbi:uncharacterized protein LOC143238946 [Tachypleus tridentatus]|uniref:uncharacterized protein LOC143238946 n=1 Tax=Tachypleus tridentatus TaxID=6853 RepID=UPI003FCFF97B
MENAAVKIQANFRGHLARKQLHTSDIQQKQDSFQELNVTPSENNENLTISSLNGLTEEKEMENAAVKIQANFRGHLARKQLHTSDIQQKQDSFQELNVTPSENNENSTFSSLNGLTEDKEMENAAVKIQANFRGHLARKQLHTSDIQQKQDSFQEVYVTPNENNENLTLSSLNGLIEDKEMENAAVKIQANFRGHLARKQLHTSDIQQKQDSFQELNVTPSEKNENSTFSSLNGLTEEKEMENAAVKIQANFRGHLARKQLHTSDIQQKQDSFQDTGSFSNDLNEIATFNSQSGTIEDKEMENATIKLQANFRGYLTRKNLRENDNFESNSPDRRLEKETENYGEYDTFQTQDIGDQKEIARNYDEEKSAIIIQAAFRGHMARREMTKPEVDICTRIPEVTESSNEKHASDEDRDTEEDSTVEDRDTENNPAQVATFE